MARASEFDIIARHFAPLSRGAPGAFDLTNDAAVWRPTAGMDAVITSDCLVAGVHFLTADPPASVAAKLLAVNLSDLAAMGAAPVGYTLAAAWPAEIDDAWIEAFAEGLGRAQAVNGVVLFGGDTVSTPGPVTLTITAFGEAAAGRALSRSGAEAGDDVYVTGTIGDAALGLRVLQGTLAPPSKEAAVYLAGRYREPTARTKIGVGLAGLATSAIDVSDGLAADLGHLAAGSGTRFDIQAEKVPVSPAVAACLERKPALLESVFGGGDDYELAFTASPDRRAAMAHLAETAGVGITRIGSVEAAADDGPGVRFLDAAGADVTPKTPGFRHF
jgi:thiamine-monophosphate kinase